MKKHSEIKQLIAEGNTENALKMLQKLTQHTPLEDDVMLLSGRLQTILHDKMLGTADEELIGKETNQINQAVLQLLSRLENTSQNKTKPAESLNFWQVNRLLLLLGLLAAIGLFVYFRLKRSTKDLKTYEFQYVQQGFPSDFIYKIDSLQKAGQVITYLSFGPAPEYREWMILYGRNEYIHNNQISRDLKDTLEMLKRTKDINLKGLYLGKNSNYLIWYDAYDYWYTYRLRDSLPKLLDTLDSFIGQQREIKDIAIASDNSWVVLWSRNKSAYFPKEGSIFPLGLFHAAYVEDEEFKQMSFGRYTPWDWVLLYGDNSYEYGTPDEALLKALQKIQKDKKEILKIFMRRSKEWIVFYK